MLTLVALTSYLCETVNQSLLLLQLPTTHNTAPAADAFAAFVAVVGDVESRPAESCTVAPEAASASICSHCLSVRQQLLLCQHSCSLPYFSPSPLFS